MWIVISVAKSFGKRAQIFARFPRHQCQGHERFAGIARIDLSYSLASPFLLASRLLPYGFSVVSLSIGEPFADDPLNGTGGSLYIVYAKSNTIDSGASVFPCNAGTRLSCRA
jgi:hypothetical protein